MKIHSDEKIRKLRELRRKGYSILQLVEEFKMPKTTVWHHVHNINLPKEIIEEIKSRQGGSRIRIQKQWSRAKEIAYQVVRSVDLNKIAPIILSLLYWAEGNKRGFIFTNTDGNMVRVFLKTLREGFGIKNNDISAIIRINDFHNASQCIRYWRKITNVPLKNIKTNLNSNQNKSKTKYGILRITVKKGGRLFKVVNSLNNELTSKILSAVLEIKHPLVAQMD